MTPERPSHPDAEPQPARVTLDEVVQQAVETLLLQGQHVPTIIAEGDLNVLLLAIADMGQTFEERRLQMALAGFAMAHRAQIGSLRQVFFISEAWMSTGSKDTRPFRQPSQDPNRKEVLTIANQDVLEQKTRLILFEMLRDTDGHLREVREHQGLATGTDVTAESPLLEAFVDGFQHGSGHPRASG